MPNVQRTMLTYCGYATYVRVPLLAQEGVFLLLLGAGPPPWPFGGSVTGSEPKSKPERRLAASYCIPAFTCL